VKVMSDDIAKFREEVRKFREDNKNFKLQHAQIIDINDLPEGWNGKVKYLFNAGLTKYHKMTSSSFLYLTSIRIKAPKPEIWAKYDFSQVSPRERTKLLEEIPLLYKRIIWMHKKKFKWMWVIDYDNHVSSWGVNYKKMTRCEFEGNTLIIDGPIQKNNGEPNILKSVKVEDTPDDFKKIFCEAYVKIVKIIPKGNLHMKSIEDFRRIYD